MDQSPDALQRAGFPRFVRTRGVYVGWWVAGAVAMVAFSRVAFFNPVLGIFIEPLEAEFGWSRTTIAGALTVGTLVGAGLSPLIGVLMDRYGGRYFMPVAMTICGVSLILLSMIDSVWQFYLLFGTGRAIVTGIIDLAVIVTISNWFIRGRGRAMGLMMVGTRGAMTVMPLVVLLAISLADWRAAFAALGVVTLLLGIVPPWLLVRRRPEDVGLRPDGDRPLPPLREEARQRALEAGTDDENDPRWTVREAIRTRTFWLLLAATGQLFLVGGSINLAMASHLQDNGLSQSTAIVVITVWAFLGVIGGIIGGELRQRAAIRYLMPAVLVGTSIGIVLLIIVDNVWMAFLFAVVHGLVFGMQFPLNQVLFPDYFGRWSVGAIRGVTAPVQFGMNAMGPLIATLVFDVRGSFDLIFSVYVGLVLFAALLILSAKPPKRPAAIEVRPDG